MCYSDSECGFYLDIGFMDHLRITKSKHNSLTELRTATSEHIMSSLSSVNVSW
jgi:hypothetical protein